MQLNHEHNPMKPSWFGADPSINKIYAVKS